MRLAHLSTASRHLRIVNRFGITPTSWAASPLGKEAVLEMLIVTVFRIVVRPKGISIASCLDRMQQDAWISAASNLLSVSRRSSMWNPLIILMNSIRLQVVINSVVGPERQRLYNSVSSHFAVVLCGYFPVTASSFQSPFCKVPERHFVPISCHGKLPKLSKQRS